MKQDTINHRPGVAEMTPAYDPAYSYVVIEHRLGIKGQDNFLQVDAALSCLKKKIVDQKLVRDSATGEKRMIIKMKQQETEEIMMFILGTSLKKNFHCYVY